MAATGFPVPWIDAITIAMVIYVMIQLHTRK